MLKEKPFYLGVTFGFGLAIAAFGLVLGVLVLISPTFYRALAIQLSDGSLVGPFSTAGIVAAVAFVLAYCTVTVVVRVHDALAA